MCEHGGEHKQNGKDEHGGERVSKRERRRGRNADGDVDVGVGARARVCGAVRTHGGRALIPALFELPVVVVLRDGAEAVVGQPAHDAVAAHAEDGLLPLLTVGDEGDDVVELAEQAFLPLLGGLLALGRGEHGGDLGPRGWCRCLLLERLDDMVEFCCGREVSVGERRVSIG